MLGKENGDETRVATAQAGFTSACELMGTNNRAFKPLPGWPVSSSDPRCDPLRAIVTLYPVRHPLLFRLNINAVCWS